MTVKCRRRMCFILLGFLALSLVSPSYWDENVPCAGERSFSYSGLRYAEYVRELYGGTGFEQEAGRPMLQARRRVLPRTNSPGIFAIGGEGISLAKTNIPRELGVLCMMVFLTIIVYIFRTDGKKRVVNE